jgi:hypothetical protein
MSDRRKQLAGWVGIAAFFLLYWAVNSFVLSPLNIGMEDEEGATSILGMVIFFIMAICALKIGQMVDHRLLVGNDRDREQLGLNSTLIGLLSYAAIAIVLSLADRGFHTEFAHNVFTLLYFLAALGCYWSANTWYKHGIVQLDEKHKY